MKPIKKSEETSVKSAKIKKRKPCPAKFSICGADLDFYVPPIDVSASSVDRIYPLEKIFTPEQYEAIYNEMSQKEFHLEFSKTVAAIFKSRTFTKEQTVLAMFLSGLHKLNTNFKKRKITPSYSSKTLNEYIRQNFVLLNCSTKQQNDRIVGYALVLSMLINDYRVNFLEFVEDFNIGCNRALQICEATGATLQEVHWKRMLVLKLPLKPRKIYYYNYHRIRKHQLSRASDIILDEV